MGIFAWITYAAYRLVLLRVNRWRQRKVVSMTPEEIDEENNSDVRVGDKKRTFQYTT